MGEKRRRMMQDELLTEMHQLGYDDVTERQVVEFATRLLEFSEYAAVPCAGQRMSLIGSIR